MGPLSCTDLPPDSLSNFAIKLSADYEAIENSHYTPCREFSFSLIDMAFFNAKGLYARAHNEHDKSSHYS